MFVTNEACFCLILLIKRIPSAKLPHEDEVWGEKNDNVHEIDFEDIMNMLKAVKCFKLLKLLLSLVAAANC